MTPHRGGGAIAAVRGYGEVVCRLGRGSLEVRTVLGDVSYEVDLDGEKHVLNAALDETGTRLALTLGTNPTPGGVYASQQLVSIDLVTGGRRGAS